MKIQIIAEFKDSKDQFGNLIDGTECYQCNTIDELYDNLKELYKSDKLTHVHLDFIEKNLSNELKGTCTIAFKNGITPVTHF